MIGVKQYQSFMGAGLQDTMYTHIRKYIRGDNDCPNTERYHIDYPTKKIGYKLLFSKLSFEKALPYKLILLVIGKWMISILIEFSKRNISNELFNMYPSSSPILKDMPFKYGVSWHFWEYQPLLIYGNLNSLQYLRKRIRNFLLFDEVMIQNKIGQRIEDGM